MDATLKKVDGGGLAIRRRSQEEDAASAGSGGGEGVHAGEEGGRRSSGGSGGRRGRERGAEDEVVISEAGVISRRKSSASKLSKHSFKEDLILLETLGRGVCGTVSKAISARELRFYAVKEVVLSSKEQQNQFKNELMGLMSALRSSRGNHHHHHQQQQHPHGAGSRSHSGEGELRMISANLIRMYDAFVTPEAKTVSIVMEFCEGGSVQDLINAAGQQEVAEGEPPGLGEDVAATIAADALSGLLALHRMKQVHRDIKPANMLVSSSGRVRVADFGLLKSFEDQFSQSNINAAGTSTGPLNTLSASLVPSQGGVRGGGAAGARIPTVDEFVQGGNGVEYDGNADALPNVDELPVSPPETLTQFSSDLEARSTISGRNKLCRSLSRSFSSTGLYDRDIQTLWAQSFVGTIAYMSPERLMGQAYSYTCDIWSLGLSILAALLGRHPLAGSGAGTERGGSEGNYWNAYFALCQDAEGEQESPAELDLSSSMDIKRGSALFSLLPEAEFNALHLSSACQNFLHLCLQRHPSRRPKTSVLRRHPFIVAALRDTATADASAPGNLPDMSFDDGDDGKDDGGAGGDEGDGAAVELEPREVWPDIGREISSIGEKSARMLFTPEDVFGAAASTAGVMRQSSPSRSSVSSRASTPTQHHAAQSDVDGPFFPVPPIPQACPWRTKVLRRFAHKMGVRTAFAKTAITKGLAAGWAAYSRDVLLRDTSAGAIDDRNSEARGMPLHSGGDSSSVRSSSGHRRDPAKDVDDDNDAGRGGGGGGGRRDGELRPEFALRDVPLPSGGAGRLAPSVSTSSVMSSEATPTRTRQPFSLAPAPLNEAEPAQRKTPSSGSRRSGRGGAHKAQSLGDFMAEKHQQEEYSQRNTPARHHHHALNDQSEDDYADDTFEPEEDEVAPARLDRHRGRSGRQEQRMLGEAFKLPAAPPPRPHK